MSAVDPKVMSWGMIAALVAATGMFFGVVLGFIGSRLAAPPGQMTAGVGASMGVVAAFLVTRRRMAQAQARLRGGDAAGPGGAPRA